MNRSETEVYSLHWRLRVVLPKHH